MTALGQSLEVHSPGAGDAPAMAALMVRGNLTYREWAPRFWRPPGVERTQAQWNLRLREPDRWTRVGVDDAGDLVALVSWRPAREHGDEGAPTPGVGYVSHLYVDFSWSRRGIARGLLDLTEEAMRNADIARAVLWAAERAPARGFYERCGWRLDGRKRWSTELQLPMVAYEKHL